MRGDRDETRVPLPAAHTSRIPCANLPVRVQMAGALAHAVVSAYVMPMAVSTHLWSTGSTTGVHSLYSRRAWPTAMADGGDIREAMLDVLYSGVDAREVLDTSVPSHMRLELDEETKKPVLPRMTYVDEQTCIGCKNCACVAKNTFFMEDDFGKARVYQQGGDTVEDIAIAIDTCPVNCIHYVSHEDLVILEQERMAREGDVTINNYGSFKQAWTGGALAVPKTKALFYNNPAMGMRCNNCPSRGCRECPMFGVGQNPIYLERLEERRLKREASGEAAAERADMQRAEIIGGFLSDYAAPVLTGAVTGAVELRAAMALPPPLLPLEGPSASPRPLAQQPEEEPFVGEEDEEAGRQQALSALFSTAYAVDGLDEDDMPPPV